MTETKFILNNFVGDTNPPPPPPPTDGPPPPPPPTGGPPPPPPPSGGKLCNDICVYHRISMQGL